MDESTPTYKNMADRLRSLAITFKYARTRAAAKRMVRTQGIRATVRSIWSDPYAFGG